MTSTAATTQINVRIDRKLKDSGDAALSGAGLTPSEAIRALWELAVRLKETPEALRDVLFPHSAEELNEAARRRSNAIARARAGQSIVFQAWQEAHIPPAATTDVGHEGDAELYIEALLDRCGTRWSL